MPNPNTLKRDILVLFNGPVHYYVTPKLYKETKPDTGKVSPTWDYRAVEVYGKPRMYFNIKSDEFRLLLATIANYSKHMEMSIMSYGKKSETRPCKVEGAPEQYIKLSTKNIIGIAIEITLISSRFKQVRRSPQEIKSV